MDSEEGTVTVNVPPLSLEPMRDLLEAEQWEQLEKDLERARELLFGRRLLNINSTAAGGGVAEMLWSWVGLGRGAGLSVDWITMHRTPEFFALSKRLHSHLSGKPGDGDELGPTERSMYEAVSRLNAEEILRAVAPGDVILLHDPQTAGLIPHLAGRGCTIIWRCHIGSDDPIRCGRAGWEFLAPYIAPADACIFYRESFIPDCCLGIPTVTILPAIDALSTKNQELEQGQIEAILRQTGLLAGGAAAGEDPVFERRAGGAQRVERRCELTSDGHLPESGTPLVVQVSRWDRLKDPLGVLRGFAAAPLGDAAHLVLAGPQLGTLSGGGPVLAECRDAWRELPDGIRGRVHLACLPTVDREENGAIVNALQRQASVVVQKSLGEGFGLTVTEALWKRRLVLASAVGGIRDQIHNGVTGALLDDPLDLDAFGTALAQLLESPERAQRIGTAAREYVRSSFLVNRPLSRYVEFFEHTLVH
jgi:trehalose synthase